MSAARSECLVAFGRYNPPHIGHTELFEAGLEYAKTHNMDYIICPTNTFNCEKNPLKLEQKLKYLGLIAPKYSKYILFNKYPNALTTLVTEISRTYNAKKVEKYLNTIGYSKVTIYHTEPSQFNNPKEYNGIKPSPISAVEAKERRYDNISATKIRKAVLDNSFDRFVSYYTIKNKSVNNRTRNTTEFNLSEEKRKLETHTHVSLNNNELYINTTKYNSKNTNLIGILKINDLVELFNILKTQLLCKEPLRPIKLQSNIERRIKRGILEDPYFNQ